MPSPVPADFQPGELSAVLAEYELGEIVRIDRQLRGSQRSPKAVVTTSRGRFLLKRRARGRDNPVKVAGAHAVQTHLLEQGFPLPRLIAPRGGPQTMLRVDTRIYELFEFVPGGVYDQSVEATADAGRVLGRFHRGLAGFRGEWVPSSRGYHDATLTRDHLEGVPGGLNGNGGAPASTEVENTVRHLSEAYERAGAQVNEAGFRAWGRQIVHGDWHPGNMLFADGRVAAVIDYDSLHLLPPVTDLANGALQFSILGGPAEPGSWPDELDEDRFCQFLLGYEQEAGTPPEQLAALPALMVEALIAEAVTPIAATGSFGRLEGLQFLAMIGRKVDWLAQHGPRLVSLASV